ncbi:murein biosynthesis integral membrane protein MurJ [Arcobacter sp. FWKO B]|uniref:murein biosynthesis integral membrane protein MurJ n=1 Tax=Arcobacter sp. FWKO B TaxID=2593672 RepID=UPI0018A5EEFE|nr:murein biosynthesis integral membrane protein MurJ [Arcobacter sp. FWKO B]QOG13199.1 murein biosynthesis integral membrane protein MurJ [Arcobacter sp. FWKO B]
MIIKAFFTNSFGILVSRVLGFIRDLLTASILGANIYSDIFFVAFKLPNLFRTIFAEGAFTQAFIPAYARATKKARFSTIIFLNFMGFLILLSIFVTLFATLVTKAIAIGFDEVTVDLAAPLVAINFYYLPLIFIVTFMGALLQYKNHFATTAFSTALLNIAMIIALLLARGEEQSEIVYYLSYGVLCGGILQVISHIIALRNKKLTKNFVLSYKRLKRNTKNRTKEFYNKFFHSALGSSTAQISAFIDTWLASFLVSGSISYLYYANRLFQLPLALFAIALSIALFPSITRAIKNENRTLALIMLKKSFWILLGLLSIATIIGISFASEIVWLLFERGAFGSDDTYNTSMVLIAYLIGLLPFGITKIFSLWLYSHQKQLVAAKISAKSLIANIIFSLILIYPLGAFGLALASTLSGFILFYLTIKEFGFRLFIDNIIKTPIK